jgi:hypothetical protein
MGVMEPPGDRHDPQTICVYLRHLRPLLSASSAVIRGGLSGYE